MVKHSNKLFIFFLSFLLIFSAFVIKPDAAFSENSSKTRISAVLVLDSSSSMKKSDPEGLRYEAVKLFMDMCHSTGDSIGIAAYGDKILLSKELTQINSEADKNSIKNSITSIPYADATDIGTGLKKAVEMLSKNSTSSASPVIILLSDGKNDPARSVSEADADIISSIMAAKSSGYPIYTIGLNADKTVDKQQLQKFSDETGGKSFITDKASDLPSILKDIFTDKFQLKAISGGDIKLSGQPSELKFNVSDLNASEGNIILMSSSALKARLFDSANHEISIPSDSVQLSSSQKYTLLKLISPKQGDYRILLSGKAGASVNVNYIFNYDYQLDAQFSPDKNIKRGDTIKVLSFLSLNGQRITDSEKYKLLNAKLSITNLNDNTVNTLPLTNSGDSFTGEYIVAASGSFSLQVIIDSKSFYRVSAPFLLNIENHIPSIKTKPENIRLKSGSSKNINLADMFTDADSDALSYTVDSTPSGTVDLSVTNGILKISCSNIGTSLVTVTATDGKGGSNKCDFQVTTYEAASFSDYTDYILIAATALIIIFILILLAGRKKSQKKSHHKKKTSKRAELKNYEQAASVEVPGVKFNGQVMIEVTNEATGVVDPPQFRRLNDFNSEISLHELLLEMPEYAETKKIHLISEGDKILVKNRSVCLINKNGMKPDNINTFTLEGGDVLIISLLSTKKSIKLGYYIKQ